jgi:hypothetical protein
MGIYGVLFAVLVAATVFLVVAIFFGVERGTKAASATLTAIGTIPILAGIVVYFGIWFFGLGCLLFNWCPLVGWSSH